MPSQPMAFFARELDLDLLVVVLKKFPAHSLMFDPQSFPWLPVQLFDRVVEGVQRDVDVLEDFMPVPV